MQLESAFDDRILGASKGPMTLDRSNLIRHASALMASQSRRELVLFGRDLDPQLYDSQPFLDGVRRLALHRPSICVRILLFDTRKATGAGHRLIELSRKLTSRIAIQRVCEDDRERLDAFLIADERGYIRRRLADTMEAVADFDNPQESRLLRMDFEQMWERSSPDTEMRRLFL
ncbi:hypothetical protein ThidrDRAFT_0321 [Thiorhodococcus drewsii AZ1]|uniref:DUF7931 domain-containing protein n=1 Tax=Thiorhodococcus drewsii AZ1 TaxID=765913 RepID=G2DWD2_9GAMM|nr:hypothetical protein [Thiorhodococcus drewsii]EGV33632.1 hypothetical protein ThidrDRAFT_0321 [Thiorhodococcus drewsii AZ1]